MPKPPYPFPFLGQGFATSYKCLEGYLWFVKPPPRKDHKRILAMLPEPVQIVARIERDLLHFGSDDALEGHVKASYNPKYRERELAESMVILEQFWDAGDQASYVPTRRDWQEFCDDFASVVQSIHKRWKLRLVIKPDDGEYGIKLGPWHRWSVKQVAPVARLAAADPHRTTRDLSYLAANLIRDVFGDDLPPVAQRADWLAWLDKLVAEGDRDVRPQFVEWAAELVAAVPETKRAAIVKALRVGTRKAISS